MRKEEKPLLFDELAEYIQKNFQSDELKWKDITDRCIHRLSDGRPEGSTYLVGLHDISLSNYPVFSMGFNVSWSHPIEDTREIYNNWLGIKFRERFMQEEMIYVPKKIVIWYQNPNFVFANVEGISEKPCFEMRYDFPDSPSYNARLTLESFKSEANEFFSIFEGLPKEARPQLSALIEKIKTMEINDYSFIVSDSALR
jgi:hypothetical protein